MTKIPPMPEELRFDHESHVKLWNWLAENPNKYKDDWPEWPNYGEVDSLCFSCDAVAKLEAYANKHHLASAKLLCNLCPLTWKWSRYCQTNNERGLWDKWNNAKTLEKRAEYARQIRDLPVNDRLERAWQEIQEALRHIHAMHRRR